MDSKEKIGKNLRKARKNLGLKQSEVAKRAGISSNYYAMIERGEENPSWKVLEELFKVLKVKSSDILP